VAPLDDIVVAMTETRARGAAAERTNKIARPALERVPPISRGRQIIQHATPEANQSENRFAGMKPGLFDGCHL
jgi:hypothetical protein